jgi:capsular polysaccharide transport system permease protein
MRLGYRSVLFFLFFLLPLALFSYYELRVATDRFHSDSSISITQDSNTAPTLDLSMIGLPSAANDKDALTLVTFANSLDMLQYLEGKLQLRAHYSDPKIDWYSRLPAEASLEDFHKYMSHYIVVEYDETSNLVNLHVQSFSREFAQKILLAVLERSQAFVDHLNSRVTVEQTKFFENQLKVSEARVRDAKAELLRFQRENGILTTDTEAQMINASISTLNGVLLSKQGELEVKRRELNENSPVIQNLRAEIDTLAKQIASEKSRLSLGAAGSTVSELAAKFGEIQFNLEFVETIYKSNLAQLERARVEAIQRLKYLIIVTSPSLADASLYPDRVYNIGTAALLLLIAFFVISLMVAIIREHA